MTSSSGTDDSSDEDEQDFLTCEYAFRCAKLRDEFLLAMMLFFFTLI